MTVARSSKRVQNRSYTWAERWPIPPPLGLSLLGLKAGWCGGPGTASRPAARGVVVSRTTVRACGQLAMASDGERPIVAVTN